MLRRDHESRVAPLGLLGIAGLSRFRRNVLCYRSQRESPRRAESAKLISRRQFHATQIIELPTNRSPYSLMTLSPGVIATGNTGTGPIVNGGRSNTSTILFDGQDTRN
jgi:hypothetical protein